MRDDAAGGWRLSGQKTWTTRGAFCTHLFGLFRSDPERRTPPRPHVLPRRPRVAGRHRARRSNDSTATKASPRCSSTTCSSPTPTCSASRTRAGASRWRPPAPSAGSRCAPPAASWRPRDRLIDLARRTATDADADPLLRDRLAARVDRRGGVPLADVLDRDPPRRRASAGRRVEHGEGVLVGARRAPARARARAARPARRARSTARTRRG